MTNVISIAGELAFLLADNPDAINTVTPQQLLHAVIPDTAQRTKVMPKGATGADFWMLRNGNPLENSDSALAFAKEAGVIKHIEMRTDLAKFATARIEFANGSTAYAESITLPMAICIAALNYAAFKVEEQNNDD